jgi:hypothetical protein
MLPIKNTAIPPELAGQSAFIAIIVQLIIVPDNELNPPAKTYNRALLTIYFYAHTIFTILCWM